MIQQKEPPQMSDGKRLGHYRLSAWMPIRRWQSAQWVFSIVLLTLTLLCVWFQPLHAATYYVSTTGSNTNPGTQAQPWRTIQKAADSVTAGDTVLVLPGDYGERVIFGGSVTGTVDAKITFKAETRRTVYMKGFRTRNCHYLVIEGFNITFEYGGWLGSGIWIDSNNVEIIDNYFYDVGGSAIAPNWQVERRPYINNAIIRNNRMYKCNKGIVISGSGWLVKGNEVERLVYYNEDADYCRFFGENHVIRNNYFHGTLAGEIGASHTDGFQTFGNNGGSAKNILIENNIVSGFVHQAFMMTGDSGLHEDITIRNNIFNIPGSTWGINARGIANLKVYNNIFANGSLYGIGFRYSGVIPTTGEVKNNIFYNNGTNSPYWKEVGCKLDGSNNVLYREGNTISQESFPNDIVNQDPKFVDPVNRNFKLQSSSPAINAGLTLSGFATGILGVSRPQGVAWDIGPYEYGKDSLFPPRNLRVMDR